MLPIRDENPKPPGYKPKMTIALIVANVIIFFFEVLVTGQFFEFSNNRAAALFYDWGAVPACIAGEQILSIQAQRSLALPNPWLLCLVPRFCTEV